VCVCVARPTYCLILVYCCSLTVICVMPKLLPSLRIQVPPDVWLLGTLHALKMLEMLVLVFSIVSSEIFMENF